MAEKSENLWSKLPHESETAFDAFQKFKREPGRPRDLKAFAQKTGVTYSVITNWSWRHKWKLRVQAWDVHSAQALDKATISEQISIAKEQLRAWAKVRMLADATLSRLAKDIMDDNKKSPGMSITYNSAVQALNCATAAERLITGEVTARTEEHSKKSLDLTKLSDEELQALEILEKKAAV